MYKIPLPSKEELQRLLVYNSETGQLFWRKNGKPALVSIRDNGFCGRIKGKMVNASRVIWKLMYDEEPDVMDHINGDHFDNRLVNLRNTNQSMNRHNAIPTVNKSGFRGVYWHDRDKLWQTEIKVNGERIRLGFFKELEDAIVARKRAEELYVIVRRD